MNWHDIALISAGALGSLVAVIHSLLVRRLMTRPLLAAVSQEPSFKPSIERLVPALLDFSGFNWFVSGLVLIAATLWFSDETKLFASLLVGSSFLFAAIGNCWGTRGRHPGWVLYAIAVGLIACGSLR